MPEQTCTAPKSRKPSISRNLQPLNREPPACEVFAFFAAGSEFAVCGDSAVERARFIVICQHSEITMGRAVWAQDNRRRGSESISQNRLQSVQAVFVANWLLAPEFLKELKFTCINIPHRKQQSAKGRFDLGFNGCGFCSLNNNWHV